MVAANRAVKVTEAEVASPYIQAKRTIVFNEEAHSYTDEFKQPYISATQLIGSIEPVYDSEFWAVYRAIDQVGIYQPRPYPEERKIEIKYQGSRAKYSLAVLSSGILPIRVPHTRVLQDWEQIKDDACEWGTAKHNYLEGCINQFAKTNTTAIHEIQKNMSERGFSFRVMNMEELEKSPLQFTYKAVYDLIAGYVKAGWTVFAEKRVYNAYYRIAGTIDLLLVRGKECIIIDWKTNRKKLKFESGYYKKAWNIDRTDKIETDEWVKTKETFKYPLQSLSLCKGNIYAMQLSVYHYLCELWGINRVATILVHLRPKVDANGKILFDTEGNRLEEEPEFYNMPYLKKEAHTLFEYRKSTLQ
jgi:PD-(D/E)XK nuclease superfamily